MHTRDHFAFRASYAVSGWGDSVKSSGYHNKTDYQDIIDISTAYNMKIGGRLHVSPIVHLKYSRLNVDFNGSSYEIDDFAPAYGLQLGDNFNCLGYSYNPHFGGCHRFDLLTCFASSPNGKAGTMYSIYHGDKVKMLRIRFYFEGTAFKKMSYINRQPLPQKLVSYGLLTPVIAAGGLIYAITLLAD
jgi:hypothetical protein